MATDVNLLPPSRREVLLKQGMRQYAARFVNSITMGLTLMTLLGILAIIFLYGLTSSASSEQETKRMEVETEYNTLRTSIASQNAFLSAMTEVTATRKLWSQHAYDLLSVLPGGVYIQAMSGTGGEKPIISFSGKSSTRNALIVLQQRLEGLPWVTSVEAPNSNLVDRINAPYAFTVSIK